MSVLIDDSHFKTFACDLARAIEQYGDLSEETLIKRQRRQMETLVELEVQFREALVERPSGVEVFKAFVSYICDERKNILAARPFFRERQPVFTEHISKALKARSHELLYGFHFNFQFVQFAVQRYKDLVADPYLIGIAGQIANLRTELVEMNMPLAISRARIFWSRTPKSQLSYMDLVQIACEGLISAIDKFCLPFSPVFRAVAIGRITGNFIEQYSETLVHFFPVDKRKIYRANKLMSRFAAEHVDFAALAEEINKDVDEVHKTNASEIADLLAAASCVSADGAGVTGSDSDGDIPTVNRFAAPVTCQPDTQYEHREAMAKLEEAIDMLPLIERKLIRLKGCTL